MGIVRKLFNATPKEELSGIRLNAEEPFWEIEGETNFPSLLNALKDLLDEDSILYFEGGSPRGELLDFIKNNSIPEQTHIAVGTLWPRPAYYHIPASVNNLTRLSELTESVAEPELAVHFHVYRKGIVLLEWHDAFTQPMLLSSSLQSDSVKRFADKLRMKIKK